MKIFPGGLQDPSLSQFRCDNAKPKTLKKRGRKRKALSTNSSTEAETSTCEGKEQKWTRPSRNSLTPQNAVQRRSSSRDNLSQATPKDVLETSHQETAQTVSNGKSVSKGKNSVLARNMAAVDLTLLNYEVLNYTKKDNISRSQPVEKIEQMDRNLSEPKEWKYPVKNCEITAEDGEYSGLQRAATLNQSFNEDDNDTSKKISLKLVKMASCGDFSDGCDAQFTDPGIMVSRDVKCELECKEVLGAVGLSPEEETKSKTSQQLETLQESKTEHIKRSVSNNLEMNMQTEVDHGIGTAELVVDTKEGYECNNGRKLLYSGNFNSVRETTKEQCSPSVAGHRHVLTSELEEDKCERLYLPTLNDPLCSSMMNDEPLSSNDISLHSLSVSAISGGKEASDTIQNTIEENLMPCQYVPDLTVQNVCSKDDTVVSQNIPECNTSQKMLSSAVSTAVIEGNEKNCSTKEEITVKIDGTEHSECMQTSVEMTDMASSYHLDANSVKNNEKGNKHDANPVNISPQLFPERNRHDCIPPKVSEFEQQSLRRPTDSGQDEALRQIEELDVAFEEKKKMDTNMHLSENPVLNKVDTVDESDVCMQISPQTHHRFALQESCKLEFTDRHTDKDIGHYLVETEKQIVGCDGKTCITTNIDTADTSVQDMSDNLSEFKTEAFAAENRVTSLYGAMEDDSEFSYSQLLELEEACQMESGKELSTDVQQKVLGTQQGNSRHIISCCDHISATHRGIYKGKADFKTTNYKKACSMNSPEQCIPTSEATQKLRIVITELSALNALVLRTRREIESVWKQQEAGTRLHFYSQSGSANNGSARCAHLQNPHWDSY